MVKVTLKCERKAQSAVAFPFLNILCSKEIGMYFILLHLLVGMKIILDIFLST